MRIVAGTDAARTILLLPFVGALACGAAETDERAQLGCADCAIQLEYLATIGEGTGPGALDPQIRYVTRDGRGRFFATLNIESLPFIYSAAGTFEGRLGQVGEGPGEFLSADVAFTRDDSLYVLDGRQGRVHVFDGDLRFVRSMSGIAPFSHAIPIEEGRFIANNKYYGGPPFTLYGPEGETLRDFGEPPDEPEPLYAHFHAPHALARSSMGGAWSVKSFFEPVIREWSSDGKLLREIPFEVNWYEPYEKISNPSPDQPGRSVVLTIQEDENRLLWIVGRSADERWASALGEPREGEGGISSYPIVDLTRAWDMHIVVVDPGADGAIVHERRLDTALFTTGSDLLIDGHADDLGFMSLDLYHVRRTP